MQNVIKIEPLKYDNCKDCASMCEHAGKNREFVYRGESCKRVKNRQSENEEILKLCNRYGITVKDIMDIVERKCKE